MPARTGRVPSYTLHRASGKAVVRLEGKDHYLGEFGSPESHSQYATLIAQWQRLGAAKIAEGAKLPLNRDDHAVTIAELILKYAKFAAMYYSRDGKPTHEFSDIQYSLRPLRQLFGSTRACEFGPLKLKDLQQHMIGLDWSRRLINARVNRVKRFFKWAVSEELVSPSILEGLRAVSGLRYGRCNAREMPPVKPVSDVHVEPVLAHLSAPVHAMVRLQRLTGMRPCEVVVMRGAEIDRSEEVWVYEPLDHKNRWRGHTRLIPLGPQAQAILRPLLERPADQFLFSPHEAEAKRNEDRKRRRRTPMTPSQRLRELNKKKRERAPGDRYDVNSYRRAIQYAISRANRGRPIDGQIPVWFPLQLRHTRATEIRKLHGIEAAQVSLGHARADVTQVYAERNLHLAIDIALKSG